MRAETKYIVDGKSAKKALSPADYNLLMKFVKKHGFPPKDIKLFIKNERERISYQTRAFKSHRHGGSPQQIEPKLKNADYWRFEALRLAQKKGLPRAGRKDARILQKAPLPRSGRFGRSNIGRIFGNEMKKYVVGGYVRDLLLGQKPQDRDFVVVGSCIDDMLAAGFRQVGKGFPVFLHPDTNEEYALARREKKTGVKHGDFAFDFSPDITLFEDCRRRDFTCNALALDEETGEIVDYFDGRRDIENKTLRMIDADAFKEDPLRVLRAYRFAAVLDFDIEPHTESVLKKMIADGMLDALPAERIWQETVKALRPAANSARFFEGLATAGGLNGWFAEINALLSVPEQTKYHLTGNSFKHTMAALTRVRNDDALVKWAALTHDVGKGATPPDILPHHRGHEARGLPLICRLCDRLKAPNAYRDFALLFCREHMRIHRFNEMSAGKRYDLVRHISDNFRDRRLADMFLRCFYADSHADSVVDEDEFNAVCNAVTQICDIMGGVSLNDLPPSQKETLSRLSGERFGAVYRDCMIEYMREKTGT